MNELTINDLRVGSLVRLREDLKCGENYGASDFYESMKFKGFKKILYIDNDNSFKLEGQSVYYYSPEMIAEVKMPCQYITIYKRKEPILDEEEREYLRTIIKPFRDRVNYIVKKRCVLSNTEHILIDYDYEYAFILPEFKKGTMYKGMELERKYTLEELGL